MESKRKPCKVVRCGKIKASVWKNNVVSDNEVKTFYSVVIIKSFKDEKSGEWKESNNYDKRDLAHLNMVSSSCFNWIANVE